MDIKESKEYRLAKDWEMAVNSSVHPNGSRGNPGHCTRRFSKACTA